LELDKPISARDKPFYKPCDYCTKVNSLLGVYTTLAEDKKLLYAHIYVGVNYSVQTIHTTAGSSQIESGKKYQIRLHLRENRTQILTTTQESNHICLLEFPGFPINPKNAKEKLKTYLVFS
jgi:hypothetical protein